MYWKNTSGTSLTTEDDYASVTIVNIGPSKFAIVTTNGASFTLSP
jgi:hypothetical protein